MSERKRKLQDPDYEDFSATPPKQLHLSDEDAQRSTEEQIRAIVSKHFATEERFREEQIAELQVTLSRAQETLADFRRALVQHAYSRGDLLTSVQPHTTWHHQPSGDQGRIHPAVKKLLSWDKKTPVPIVTGTPGPPTTRRKAAALTTPPSNQDTPSTSREMPSASIVTPSIEDTTTPRLDVFSQEHSASSSVSKPSTSDASDIPSLRSTSSISKIGSDTAAKPSFVRNPSLPSVNKPGSSASILIESGVGESKSWPTAKEKEGLEEGGIRMPKYLPPSDSKGVAKPCRQMRMVGRSLKQLVVGNTSRCLSLESRPGRASHKWMLYVRFRDNQSLGELVHHVVFTLHPSYAPNDIVKITQPPFHLYRRGWGEFLARVNIHFRHPQDKPVEVTHHLKLDHSGSGVERLGSETHVKVWLHEADASDDIKSEQDRTEPTAASSDGSRSSWDPSNAHHDKEDSSDPDDNDFVNTESDASMESLLIKEEPLFHSPAETNEDKTVVIKEERLDMPSSASPPAAMTSEDEMVVIKEEPVDAPNSAMGMDIFYDDPASFSEEVVEFDVDEVECKDEPMDVKTLDIDLPAVTPDKSEVEVPYKEKVLEKSGTESAPTINALSSSDQSRSLLSNTVLSSSVSGISLPNLASSSALLNEGKIFIKLVQPDGKVIYMQVRQASNSLSAIRTPGQVTQTTGQLSQVISNPIQVVCAPGQFIRTTSQGLPVASACGVSGGSKRNPVNGHLRPRMIAPSRLWLNGAVAANATPTAPGRSNLRSVLKPLANREVSIKKEPIDNITLIGPLMSRDPLETMTQESLLFPAVIKKEPSILGPTKKVNRGGSLAAPSMGLMAATFPHRDTISRSLFRCSTERCPSIERALATLALALPLVDTRAAKPAFRCVHPYAAQSLEMFFDWPLAKRRAAERQRAVALRRQLLTLGRPPADVWPTRHIQRWLLLHGFVPTQANPAHQVTARLIHASYSEPTLARAWLEQLIEEDDPEPDIDVISVGEHLTTAKRGLLPTVEPDHGHMDTLPMSAEMEHRCLELAETTRKIGITLHPEVIAGETLYQAAARVMLEAVQLFTEEILRRSLCKAWERNRNRPPSSLQPRDVRAAVKQYFPLLSNSGLGQSPSKGQPS